MNPLGAQPDLPQRVAPSKKRLRTRSFQSDDFAQYSADASLHASLPVRKKYAECFG
jgi:hypothetical protein